MACLSCLLPKLVFGHFGQLMGTEIAAISMSVLGLA
jgi:hypothetical protein